MIQKFLLGDRVWCSSACVQEVTIVWIRQSDCGIIYDFADNKWCCPQDSLFSTKEEAIKAEKASSINYAKEVLYGYWYRIIDPNIKES